MILINDRTGKSLNPGDKLIVSIKTVCDAKVKTEQVPNLWKLFFFACK